MSFQIAYKDLRNPHFISAWNKVVNSPLRSLNAIQKVSLLKKAIQKAHKEAQDNWTKNLKQFALLDEKGEFVPISKDQPGTFQVPDEKAEAWQKKAESMDEMKTSLRAWPLKVQELKSVQDLTANDLDALCPLVEDALLEPPVDEEKEEKKVQ